MDEATVRDRAQAMADALVKGDVERAIVDLSPELRRNLGEVLGLFPLPATEATVESAEATGSAWTAIIRMVGETEEVAVSTRWKDRGGQPTVIEVSHLSRAARSAESAEPAEGGLGVTPEEG